MLPEMKDQTLYNDYVFLTYFRAEMQPVLLHDDVDALRLTLCVTTSTFDILLHDDVHTIRPQGQPCAVQ